MWFGETLPRSAVAALATFLADARIEVRALARLGALAAFAANLGVELGAVLAAHGVAALLADLREKVATIFRAHGLPSAPCLGGSGRRPAVAWRSWFLLVHQMSPRAAKLDRYV